MFRGLFARLATIVVLAVLLTAAPFHAALAQVAPPLGTAQTFAVVAETVTNTGPTLVNGNLGVSPGAIAPTGFPPGTVTGVQQIGNAVSLQAKSDARTAYDNLTLQGCDTTYLVPTDIGGMTLVPGVYCFASSAGLTGPVPLTLNGGASDVWVFKTVSTLITGPGSSVVMSGGAQDCNVFWQVGSSATLDTTTQFIGTILAHTSISLNSGANVSGRLLAGMQANGSGAVTMINNQITPSACSVAPVPPTLIKAFNPVIINVPPTLPDTSTLTITLSNPNSTAANLTTSFADTLPSGVTFVGSASNNGCGGTLTNDTTTVTLTGGSIPANGSCTVTATVTSSVVGPYVNTTTSLVTDKGTAPAASDTLTVLAPASIAPTLSKTFNPTTIGAGNTSLLTITLGNVNATAASFASFTDTLPIGVTFVGNASNNGCGGAIANDEFTLTLTGGSIPAGGSCTVTATVTSSVPGLHLNTTGALVTDKGTAPPANDTLIVNQTSPIGILKSFNPGTIGAGEPSLLTITVDNPNSIAIPVAFTDFLPSSPGQMLVATGPGPLINTCGGTLTATTGSSSVIYAGGLLPANGSCTVTVYVTAPVPGSYTNFLGTASDTLTVSPAIPPQPGLLLEKTAIPTTYTKVGDIIVYTYIIKNIGGVTLTGPFIVTDDNFLSPFQCGTATTLAPGASVTCTINYTVQAGDLGNVTSLPTGVTANIDTGAWLQGVMSILDTRITGAGPGVPNGIYPAWCIQSDIAGEQANRATLYSTIGGSLPADVAVLPWAKINYVLNHKIGVPNTPQLFEDVQTAIWALLGEPNPDFYPTANSQAMIAAANANPDFVPGPGDVVAVIIYSDGILPVNPYPSKIQDTVCEMRPPGAIINHATGSGKYGTVVVYSGEVQATVYQTAPAPAADIAPTLGKAFSPATINAGGVSTLTITLSNTNGTDANLTAPLTDSLPWGVVVSGNASTTCGGTLTFDTSKVTLTGGSIPANGSCTVTVDVTAKYKSSYYNKLPAGALQTDKGRNAAPAVATLIVTLPVAPKLSKTFSPATIKVGGVSTLTITLSNASSSVANLTAPLTDIFPSGVLIASPPSTTCGGTLTFDTSKVTLTGGSIPANGSCTVTVDVTAKNKGSYYNKLPAGALRTSNGNNATPAVATLTVKSVAPTLNKAFSPATINAGGVSTLTITLGNTNGTDANLTAPLTDYLPWGVVVSGNASTTCGGTLTANTGSSKVTLTGGSIPANGSCTVTVDVTAKNKGSYYNRLPAGALRTSNGNNAAPAVATLTVKTNSL
jgi:uncharacterized repeat protein (TIGR01451 family)